MSFAKNKDESRSLSKQKLSSIVETFLLTNKSSSAKKKTFNPKPHVRPPYYSELKPKKPSQNPENKAFFTENDEFSYLDKIKKKIERTLSKGLPEQSLEYEQEPGLEEVEDRGSQELHKLQLKEAIHRQELSKVKGEKERLMKRVMELENIVASFRQTKEKDARAFVGLERELSIEKRKSGQLESKLKKINPIKTAQLFQEILVKNECLLKEKEELEELLKQMLLEKEMQRIKTDGFSSLESHKPRMETLFKENEPQKPFEIAEGEGASKSFNSSSGFDYLYFNDGDEKIHTRSLHIASNQETVKKKPQENVSAYYSSGQKTIYERLGGSEAISKTVDLFYKKILADKRIIGYYKGVDMSHLHKHQKNFLTKITGGPDNYTGRGMEEVHQHLKIPNQHFDIVKGHLVSSLVDLKVPVRLVEEVGGLFEAGRSQCVTHEDLTKKEASNIINKESIKKAHFIINGNTLLQKQSLYEELGGSEAISKAVDLFYIKVLADKRVVSYYKGADMARLHVHQKNFLIKLCGGPDNYSGRGLKESHQHLKITDFHFDIVKGHLISSLMDLSVPSNLIDEVAKLFEGGRRDCVVSEEKRGRTDSPPQKKGRSEDSSCQKTIYERLGGSEAISKTVDLFYKKILADKRIIGYYKGVDMSHLHKHQKNFLTKITGGPDNYTGRGMEEVHQHLKIPNQHFDIVKGHLVSSLVDLKVPVRLVEEVGGLFEAERSQCVTHEDLTKKEASNIINKETVKRAHFNINDNKLLQKQSLYDKLGGSEAISNLVDLFYIKVLADNRVVGYYKGADMARLHVHQKNFLIKLCGGPDNYSGRGLKESHQHLKITDFHFDIVKGHLISSLMDLSVPSNLIDEVAKLFEGGRRDCVLKEAKSSFKQEPKSPKKPLKINKTPITEIPNSLFLKLGGSDAISKVVDLFYIKVLADDKVSSYYKGVDMSRLHDHQKNFLIKLTGGPDNYSGRSLLESHQNLKITDSHFDIVKGHLISSLKELAIPYNLIEELSNLFETGRNHCVTIQPQYSPSKEEENSLHYLQQLSSSSPQRFKQSLYLSLGGFDKVTALVEAFYSFQIKDPLLKASYEACDPTRLQHNLKYFLTKLFGGPDIFLGGSLKDCDPILNNKTEISLENLKKAARALKTPEDSISQMIVLINQRKEPGFQEPVAQSPYELLGGYKGVAGLVELLYQRLNQGSFLDLKEELDRMKQSQKFYFTKVLGGPDTFLGSAGNCLWRDPWMGQGGEEKWITTLKNCLEEIGVKEDVKERVLEILEKEVKGKRE